jgi:hypothetical protein
VADSLAGYLQADTAAALAPVALARLFRRTHHRILALPDELRSGSFDPDELEMELMDDIAYANGDAARRETITLGRLCYIRPRFPELSSTPLYSSQKHAFLAHPQRDGHIARPHADPPLR